MDAITTLTSELRTCLGPLKRWQPVSSPLMPIALLLGLEVRGLSRKGEHPILGNSAQTEAACNNGPLKSYRFLDLPSKTDPVITSQCLIWKNIIPLGPCLKLSHLGVPVIFRYVPSPSEMDSLPPPDLCFD